MKSIFIFASGNGTNAENIIRYFKLTKTAAVAAVLTNNPEAGVILKAKNLQVPVRVFNREEFYGADNILNFLLEQKPALIVLAGFLWLVPRKIIASFPKQIINIHPALLPKFGGKGMFGIHVQKEVLASGVKESGITIHYVNDRYDEGDIIFQKKCVVDITETPETLAKKIHTLENKYFSIVIESLLQEKKIESLHRD